MSPGCVVLEQRLEAIDQRITDVAKYYSDMLGLQETSLDRITDRLCLLERRLSEDENNYGRALALLEDRIKILEARAAENSAYTSGLNSRICEIEDSELNAIDERLCRLESPPVGEIDPRATGSGCSLRSVRPVRYFECSKCGGDKPCILRVDEASTLPEYCHYSGNAAAWQGVPE